MVKNLSEHPIHFGLGATAFSEPKFTGEVDWYQGYAERHMADGAEGRLMSLHHFTESWTVWEMHPVGAEVVMCLSGTIALIQQLPDGSEKQIILQENEYAINPPGVWHTADVEEAATALFITAGQGTENRDR
ncbi:MAG: cupin [Parasphingorhabdus sp.]|uniref:cupin n=1 Tax=Parasphingorhabdus sp. TaxID=2709688 RepID=UPI003296EB7D